MSNLHEGWEIVIGLEVHVQLRTAAKVFSPAPWGFGAEPNTQIDPVSLGLPGSLPVVNLAALEQAIRLGLAVDAEIPEVCAWDRKNYFYPDNPKNYQLTQMARPVVLGGSVEIELPGPSRNVMGEHRRVRLHHAHLEEDVGKLSHAAGGSLVDYNRAGVPLLEIVTEPDLRSAAEAEAFLRALHALVTQAGISDADMEKGQLRCDANVSLRRPGAPLGTRTETKNLNSISGVRAAIEAEVVRQARELEAGRAIVQETRGWNAEAGRGYVLRDKEDAQDYRYFPDPDIPPVAIDRGRIERLRAGLPERPFDRQRRYLETLGLPYTAASVLVADLELALWFEAAVAAHPANPVGVANLVANDLLRELAAGAPSRLADCKVRPAALAELVRLTDAGTLSKQQAREVLAEMFRSGRSPAEIVAALGLAQNNDTDELEKIVREVVADPAYAKSLAEIRAGNAKAINALKGPIMKRTQGKANPALVDEILRRVLG
jgi:aspartyl-tRNA(Asn)/glutamyl-tRNA(Gln) amidotransferase subunit B